MWQFKTFDVSMTSDEIIHEIGHRIAAHRLNLNMTQKELSDRAGVSLRTLIRLEDGEGNLGISALTKVLSVLNLVDRFESLFPKVEMSAQMIINGEVPRKRSRKSVKHKIWKWGDEA